MITKVKKRDGRIVDFDKTKIAEAIFKAAKAVGGRDRKLAESLADKVVAQLEKIFIDKIPSVEDIQDIVEKVLIEEGHARTAKAYILYRQERRLIREEKKRILEKEEVDEVDKNFDVNALRILAGRYLLKDEKGKLIEGPKQMFERVAIHVGIVDLLHDERIFSKEKVMNEREIEEELKDLDELMNRFDQLELAIGNYRLNQWHVEGLLRCYGRLLKEGKMKVGIKKLIDMIKAGQFDKYQNNIKAYYELMVSKDFLPNSPTLMNAGARLGQLSACFVLPIEDDLRGIMKTCTDIALISKSGGGVGVNYSCIRPKNDVVASTSGVASGPLSFMEIVNTIVDVIKQGGKRRGANMAVLEVWHPDIEEFITIKQKPKKLENFNLSVGVWQDFIDALNNDADYALVNPRIKQKVKDIPAKKVLDLIAFSAWKSAEPGILFFDNINKYNVLANAKGMIKSTNPCGEQPLYEYESCNLGSINLKNFVVEADNGEKFFDWQRYEQVIRLATRFLDNIIDINKYPIEEIEKTTRETRKIGLGVMGLSDCLFELEIAYNSKEGFEFMNRAAETLSYVSMDESCEIAKTRGSFPLFEKSDYTKLKLPVAGYYEIPKSKHHYDWEALAKKIKEHGIRNAFTTTIAPTGSISMIAGCGNGIEPAFSLVYEKHVTLGKFYYIDPVLEKKLKAMQLYNEALIEKICKNNGCLFGLSEFDEKMQKVFVTALSMHWLDHIIAQAIWQKWVSASISKTINMPNDTSVEDIKMAYLIAHELGLKGLTVFRDGSRESQVYYIATNETLSKIKSSPSTFALGFLNSIKNEVIKKVVFSYFQNLGFNIAALKNTDLNKYIEKSIEAEVKRKTEEEKNEKTEKIESKTRENFVTNIAAQKPSIVDSIQHNHINIIDNDENDIDNGKCPLCNNLLVNEAGCNKCINCGWSACVIS